MRKVFVIASLTCKEAIRKLFFQMMILLSVALLALSLSLGDFDLTGAKHLFIRDFALGIIYIFGTLMAIVVTAQTVGDEIEQRTYLTLLSKPVSPFHFAIGKFIGVTVLLLLFLGILLLQTRFLMWTEIRKLGLIAQSSESTTFWLLGAGQCLRISVIVAITLFFASYSTSYVFSIVVSTMLVMFGQIRFLMVQLAESASESVSTSLSKALLWCIPDLQRIGDVATFGWDAVFYALLTMFMFVMLSCWSFSRRTL